MAARVRDSANASARKKILLLLSAGHFFTMPEMSLLVDARLRF